jgi:hypothetical protein
VTTSLSLEGALVHPHGLFEGDKDAPRTPVCFCPCPGGCSDRPPLQCLRRRFYGEGRIGRRSRTVKIQVIFAGVGIVDELFLGPGFSITDLHPGARIKRQGAELLTTSVQQVSTLRAGVLVVCRATIRKHASISAGAVVASHLPAHGVLVGAGGYSVHARAQDSSTVTGSPGSVASTASVRQAARRLLAQRSRRSVRATGSHPNGRSGRSSRQPLPNGCVAR